MNIRKNIETSVYFLIVLFTLLSCDKLDKNGKLDGNWQLTEWMQNSTGRVVADKHDLLFYTIKLELIQFRDCKNGQSPYFAYFEYTDDNLILGQVFQNTANSDIPSTTEALAQYGVTNDGKFKITKLTSSEMILQNDENTLSFRKY